MGGPDDTASNGDVAQPSATPNADGDGQSNASTDGQQNAPPPDGQQTNGQQNAPPADGQQNAPTDGQPPASTDGQPNVPTNGPPLNGDGTVAPALSSVTPPPSTTPVQSPSSTASILTPTISQAERQNDKYVPRFPLVVDRYPDITVRTQPSLWDSTSKPRSSTRCHNRHRNRLRDYSAPPHRPPVRLSPQAQGQGTTAARSRTPLAHPASAEPRRRGRLLFRRSRQHGAGSQVQPDARAVSRPDSHDTAPRRRCDRARPRTFSICGARLQRLQWHASASASRYTTR